MAFKPNRDNLPMAERPLEVQLEAKFFQAIQPLLTKKQQGKVMCEFRRVLANFKISLEAKEGHELHTLVHTDEGSMCPRCGSKFEAAYEWEKASSTCPVCTSQYDYKDEENGTPS